MENRRLSAKSHVFIAGLHRSGTSLLARLLGAHPDIATLSGADVPEQEGCYLQGAIPHGALHGMPGHFATDPAQRHDESSPYNRLETRLRLDHDWDPWFGAGRWRLEKSPVNLTRMRLYAQLFPMAHFIVILRHPEAVAAAHAKWCDQPSDALIDYALAAHAQAEEDLAHLHAAVRLRYEDLVEAPDAALAMLTRFLGLDANAPAETVRNGTRDYAGAAPVMNDEQAARAERWGYCPSLAIRVLPPVVRHPLRARREAANAAWNANGGCWSGREDSNLRPLPPEDSALPG